MPFKKLSIPVYPPRLWVLVGYPGSGKSTFSLQMKYPLLPIDADHRFGEVAPLAGGDVYELSDNAQDSADPETIYRLLNQNMPGSGVKTITVDSLTTIITPKVVQATLESDARRERNKAKKQGEKRENLAEPFKDKALMMRLLQDAITMWGTDVLWIYHLQDSRDENAKEVTKATLSKTERARLYRSINLELHVTEETLPGSRQTRRGVKVVWARRGRSGMTLWDDTGKWAGMPEKIERAVYDGLSQADQERIEKEAPAVFATEEAAIDWGMGQGVFKDVAHAKNAFDKIKNAHPLVGLAELSALWVEDVERRVSEKASEPAPAEESTPADDTPGFTDLESMLSRLYQDFKLERPEAKALLKRLGFSGFPLNGEAYEKSQDMYRAVRDHQNAKGREILEQITDKLDEIDF
jgi:hypothetical protein